MWAAQVTAVPCRKYIVGTDVGNPLITYVAQRGTLLLPTVIFGWVPDEKPTRGPQTAHIDLNFVPCFFAC